MNDFGDNGNEKKPFGGEQVKYPVTYDLKVILDNSGKSTEHQQSIEAVLQKHRVRFTDWRSKLSSNKSYISFTVSITITTGDQMKDLYNDLKQIKGIKLAL